MMRAFGIAVALLTVFTTVVVLAVAVEALLAGAVGEVGNCAAADSALPRTAAVTPALTHVPRVYRSAAVLVRHRFIAVVLQCVSNVFKNPSTRAKASRVPTCPLKHHALRSRHRRRSKS